MTTIKVYGQGSKQDAINAMLVAGISDPCVLSELRYLGCQVILTYEVDEHARTAEIVSVLVGDIILKPVGNCKDSILIEGAGSTELNGEYVYYADVNGSKAYKMGDSGKIISKDLSLGWTIFLDTVPYYTSPGGQSGPTGPWEIEGIIAEHPVPSSRFLCP